ncbi:hypothetical protein SDC9_136060 [bioreactor metagenome]|uniref:Uncharacterized protein n=1 Tax=bioreactor metagenome TaxID=1076179 RepID=A0A645DI16_9ZZZZ|nr:hypothetical protein [Proteiniphilum sp.]MEA4918118.1 hypothetical protein [Proteiniphilum sp.]
MKLKKMDDDWIEVIIYGLLAAVLIGLSLCFIFLSVKTDRLFVTI